jgi:hypothetical protein
VTAPPLVSVVPTGLAACWVLQLYVQAGHTHWQESEDHSAGEKQ